MTGEEYVRVIKIMKLQRRLWGIQMNKTKFEPDAYKKLIADIEQELTELKNEGDK